MEPTKTFPSDVVEGTFFEHNVPLDKMFVHYRSTPGGYARPLRMHRVKKLMQHWDRSAAGVLLLSMRADGRMAIIDGQHRREAALALGESSLNALVYIDLTLEQEAGLYRKFGDYLKQTALDRYHAGIAEGDPMSTEIKRILTYRGLHVPEIPAAYVNGVVAVEALMSVYDQFGANVLRGVIGILNEAYGGDYKAYRANQIKGTAAFIVRYVGEKNYSRKRLVERLRQEGLSAVVRRARSMQDATLESTTSSWGRALLALHNQRLSDDKRLGDWANRFVSEEERVKSSERFKATLARPDVAERTRLAQLAGTAAMTPEARSARANKGARTRFGAITSTQMKCPTCTAKPGEFCKRSDGQTTAQNHDARIALAREARAVAATTSGK